MNTGRTEQIEYDKDQVFSTRKGAKRHSHKKVKKTKHKHERRRAKANPECNPEYNKYDGWEW